MASNKTSHHCEHCGKTFRQKFNYTRHVLPCEFFSKAKTEQDYEIDNSHPLPSQRDMFSLMQHMILRIDKLEKENSRLKTNNNKRKIKVLDYLNKEAYDKPFYNLADWMRHVILPDVKNYLEVVFENDLLTGITNLLTNNVTNSDKLVPFISFQCDKNTFYVYDVEKKYGTTEWMKIDSHELDQYLCRISKQFIYDFNNVWHKEHDDLIKNDQEYEEKSVHYYTKILGGIKMKDETRYKKIRENVYQTIKKHENALYVE